MYEKINLVYPYYQGGLMCNNNYVLLFAEYSPHVTKDMSSKLPDGTVVAITDVEHVEDFFENYTVLKGWILRLSDPKDTLKELKKYPYVKIYSNFDTKAVVVRNPTAAIQIEFNQQEESYEQTNSNTQGTESNSLFSKFRSKIRLGHKRKRRNNGSV